MLRQSTLHPSKFGERSRRNKTCKRSSKIKSQWSCGNVQSHPWSLELLKDNIKTEVEKLWTHEWIHSSTGTHTKRFFPRPSDATCLKGRYIHHELTQVLTGHCKLNHHLHKIKKTASPMCECGQGTETVEHFLFHCAKFTDQRASFAELCSQNSKSFPPSLEVIPKSKSLWNEFKVFVLKTERLKYCSTSQSCSTPPNSL